MLFWVPLGMQEDGSSEAMYVGLGVSSKEGELMDSARRMEEEAYDIPLDNFWQLFRRFR
jgi:hypothetical protein